MIILILWLCGLGMYYYLIFSDKISLIKSQAQIMSYEGIQDILNSIDKVRIRLKANVNFDLCIELLIMAMKEAM